MALVFNDRVKETSTTTGTGTLTLDGAVTGFETFSSAIGNTNTTYYAIELPNTAQFEVGLGTVSAGQLARTQVFSSSNSDALVDFSAGTKNVFCTLPASKFVPGKLEGTNFTNSLLIGHATTGTLSGADNNTGVGIGALDAITSGDRNVALGTSALTSLTSGLGNVAVGHTALTSMVNGISNTGIGEYALSNSIGNRNTGVGSGSLLSVVNSSFNTALGVDSGKFINTGNYNIAIGYDSGDNITSGDGNVIIGTVDADSATGDRQLKISGYDGTTTTTWISGDNSGNLTFPADLTVDTDTLYVDSTNDRVGIGTTSPSSLLHLSSSDPQLHITNTSGTTSNIIKSVSNDLVFDCGGTVKIDADGAGNVWFMDNGTVFLKVYKFGGTKIEANVADEDLIFKVNDGGSFIDVLTFDSSEAGAATFNDKITLGANKVIEFGDAGETISGDGTDLTIASSSNINLDAAAGITLDAGTSGIKLDDDGTTIGLLYFLSGNLNIKPSQSDTDLVIKGNDGGSEITALTLDMSEAGAATFNSSVTVGANLDVSSGTIKLDGNYPTGNNNVALGDNALDSVTTGGNDNTMIGDNAGTAVTTGYQNTAVGSTALNTGNATGNTAIGYRALRRATGANNTGIGRSAGDDTTTGGQNTFVGGSAGYYINGINNVAVGYQAGNGFGNTGSSNIFMGYRAGDNITSGSNNIVIGTNIDASSATVSNEITLGNASVTSLRIPGLQSGASSGDVLTYDGTDITLSAPTGVSAGFSIAMAIAL